MNEKSFWGNIVGNVLGAGTKPSLQPIVPPEQLKPNIDTQSTSTTLYVFGGILIAAIIVAVVVVSKKK